MRPLLTACLALVLLASFAPGDDAPIARLGERPFPREDFAHWLVDRVGVQLVHQYVAETLVIEKAIERGLMPTQQEIEDRYEAEHAHILKVTYGGREDRWLADIAANGYSAEGWRGQRLLELRAEMAQAALVQADRQPDEAQVAARFRERFGEAGERTELEVLFFNAYVGITADDGRPDLGKLKAAARERASAARERWMAGASHAELLADSDTAMQGSAPGGRIEAYKRNLFGKEFERTVNAIDGPGDIAPPVDVFDGTWVIRLVSRETVSLDDVREQLLAELHDEPASAGEMAAVYRAVIEQEGLEILLD